MTIIHANAVAGALDTALSNSATTMTSAGLVDLPVIAAPDIARITLYRRSSAANKVTQVEIVYVIAHTAGSNTATISRGLEGTASAAWSIGDRWDHAVTAGELNEIHDPVTGFMRIPDANDAFVAQSVVDLRGKDIHAELLALYDAGGGKAVVPMGTVIVVDGTVTLGGRVRLAGDGYGASMSVIRASATFPTDGTPLIRLDRSADATGHAPGNLLSGLVIDGNHRARVGVYSENVQEGGGVVDCQIINWTHKAVHFFSGKSMHFTLRDLWGYSSTSAVSTGIGLHLDGVASTNPVIRVTLVGSNSAVIAAGMQVDSSRVTLLDGHFENATNGLLCTGGSVVRVIGATGHNTVPTVVRAQGTTRLIWMDVIADGSTNAVIDETSGSPIVRSEAFGVVRSEQYIKGAATSRPASRVEGAATTADVVAYAQSSGVDRFRVNSDGHTIAVDRDIKRVGDGVGGWRFERADGTLKWAGYLRTDAADEFRLQSGAETKLRIAQALGGGIGFNGAAPGKPALTYSRTGETAAEAQLRGAMTDLGLVTDNTTA